MDALLDTAPCGFLSFADDGQILMVNATLCQLLGYEPEELTGQHVDSMLPLSSRIFYQTHFFPLLKLHGSVEEVYLSLRTKSGPDVPMLANAVRRTRAGCAVNDCIFVTMRQRSHYEDEILQAKRMAEEATRAKDEFLAVVSHELRTPLTAIISWSEMALTGTLDEATTRKALEAVERNARTQARLIEDILDFSRIIYGKLRLDVQEVDLANVITAALDVVRPAAAAKGIRLEFTIAPDVGPVLGDPDRLQQVMWNLLSNAVKFTPREGRVEVQLKRKNAHLEVTVSDTGQGISTEFLPYVFERFRQADNTSTRHHGGLGLGMAITRYIVELHGGTIRAYSDGAGHGATFTVELPLMPPRNPEPVSPVARS